MMKSKKSLLCLDDMEFAFDSCAKEVLKVDGNEKNLRCRLIQTIVTLTVTGVFLVLAITSYGWFGRNPAVSASGMTVSANTPDIFDTALEIFPVSAIADGAYTFVPSVAATALPTYDPSEIIPSEYQKALVLKFTYSLHNDAPVTLEWLAADDPIRLTETSDLSTVVQVRPATVTDSVAVGGTADSFVTVSGGTASKTSSLSYSLDGHAGENVAWFVIEYNKAALDYIAGQYLARPDEIPMEISYRNDMDFLFRLEVA